MGAFTSSFNIICLHLTFSGVGIEGGVGIRVKGFRFGGKAERHKVSPFKLSTHLPIGKTGSLTLTLKTLTSRGR